MSLLISHPGYAESEHVQELDNLIISMPLSQSTANTALPVSILSGDELRMKAASTIGETLKNEPGITSQSFGPGVGQPVIRGQSGSRVHVLQNGLGSLDVSSLSPDHGNSTESLWAERIEVLRGPATLLYGSGAIGGVVNVLDNRIPDAVPEAMVEGAVEQRYNTVNEGKSTAFKLDGGKGILAWHLDGFYRDSINLQIPGSAVDEAIVEEEHDEHEESSEGRLLNSNTRARSGTAGFSLIGDRGFVGFSINHLDNNYGVPPGAHEHEEEEGAEQVRIDMKQTRYDMKAEIDNPLEFAESLRVRLGYNDYQHIELENGEAGTIYSNEGFESRVELVQKPWAFFDHGVFGVQSKNSEFSALGDEAVVPKSDIDSFGIFTVQDIHTEHVTYEMGMRVEQQWIDPVDRAESSHTPVSFSTSAIWSVTDQDSIKLTFSRSQRAPDIQELFSNGPHLATASYEIGDAGLIEETSHNLELGIHIDREWLQADFNLYQNWVQDYITQINNGLFFDHDAETISAVCGGDCLPVFQSQQKDAEFQGFEAQVTIPLWRSDYGQLDSQFFGDYVRGRFSDGSDIPRMPPLRYGMELAWKNSDWTANIRMTRAERQDNPGLNEAETDGYWSLNAGANYRLSVTEHADMLLFVKANNLLDDDIRNAVSYLRNVAPEAGRGAEMGVRIEF
ncbi:TonB-dependent receptor [Methylomarinum sp. Ch1-1]|uniref:TonB-dependent receptor n=1 Tax=Methylomarinum roseum TaxID=3067653 RepID=A0AAU7NRQ3_9GAMM|nr:TonB-dependent receptor [Methylomarinum sp. Ch1-1]MDP4520340.1 TonB-dependent receptor [Methylomarinum sp. Ch1-1]